MQSCNNANNAFYNVFQMLFYSLFETHKIESGIIVQSPANWRSAAIIGVGVGVLQPELETLKKEFPGFQLTLKRKKKSVITNFLTRQRVLSVTMRTPSALKTHDWAVAGSATLELLVSAEPVSKRNMKSSRMVYAVMPAHLFLSAEQRETFADVNYKIEWGREEIEKKTTRTSFAIEMLPSAQDAEIDTPESCLEVSDLIHPPLFCYRYLCPTASNKAPKDVDSADTTSNLTVVQKCPFNECDEFCKPECHHLYLNDLALVSIETSQADELQNRLKDAQPSRHERLRRISSKRHLSRLCQRGNRIVIGNMSGKLVRLPYDPLGKQEECTKHKYAVYLPFIIKSTDSIGNKQ